MFENLIKDAERNNKPKEWIVMDLSNSPLFNPDLFREKLKNVESIPDRELFELVKNNYDTLLSEIFFCKDEYQTYLQLFTNAKFLTIFIQVVHSIQLSYQNKIYCNKLAYDYLTLKESDPYIKQLLLSLSKIVNRDVIPGLLGIGIPEDLASHMTLARYSSEKEMINIRRLILVIVNSPISIMTEQMIVWIFEKLFDRITPLFEGIMFDVYNKDKDNFTDEMEEINSTISLAVLDILNGMTSADIRKVLISYVGDYEALYYRPNQKCIRFSMSSLSSDYARITEVINHLREQEQINVP